MSMGWIMGYAWGGICGYGPDVGISQASQPEILRHHALVAGAI